VTTIRTETFGSPPARMNWIRSSRDIWFSDFCSALTLTTACVVIDISPSFPMRGALSSTTVITYVPLFEIRRSRSTS
jgi:hypothetical protein